jgi:hypothetical protein
VTGSLVSKGGSGGKDCTWGAEHTDEGCDNGPEIIISPAKADDDEQLPLVPSHPDLLDLVVTR